MIEPTIGRIVWFRPGKDAAAMRIQCDGKQPLAAIVVYVHGERRVNLDVIDAMGRHHGLLDVPLLQDDDKAPANDAPYAEWMPFQKGQAQKTEAVEKVLASAVPNVAPAPDLSIEAEIVAKGKTAPRVTPTDIEAAIVSEWYFTAAEGARIAGSDSHPLDLLTFCVLVLRNGFTVTGESACASPENFDAEIGRKIARQNAVQKIWPLEGYLLRERLFQMTQPAQIPE